MPAEALEAEAEGKGGFVLGVLSGASTRFPASAQGIAAETRWISKLPYRLSKNVQVRRRFALRNDGCCGTQPDRTSVAAFRRAP